jgi:hypothetical protein
MRNSSRSQCLQRSIISPCVFFMLLFGLGTSDVPWSLRDTKRALSSQVSALQLRLPRLMLLLRGGGVCAPDDIGAPGYRVTQLDHMWDVMRAYEETPPKSNMETEMVTMTVPGTHSDLSSVVADLQPENDIFIQAGDHRWDEYLQLPFERDVIAQFRGDLGTRLLGKWVLPSSKGIEDFGHRTSCTSGSFTRVTCAYATDKYMCDEELDAYEQAAQGDLDAQMEDSTLRYPHSVFTILGGPWVFTSCELRAAGADVLMAGLRANVTLVKSAAGGMGLPWEHNSTMAACSGVHLSDASVCTLSASTVEMCGAWGGAAIRCIDETKMRMKHTSILSSFVGMILNDAPSVRSDACMWKDNQVGHMLMADNATYAALKLASNQFWEGSGELQGEMWASQVRPGHLGQCCMPVLWVCACMYVCVVV